MNSIDRRAAWVLGAVLLALALASGCGKTRPAPSPAWPSPTMTETGAPPTRQAQDETATQTPRPPTLEPTRGATETPTPTFTPSPSPAMTMTMTPTPPALPASLSGDVRALLSNRPVPQSDAPCGLVDTLDFPLAPPHGQGAVGGQSFGGFSETYNGYHAGEDWSSGTHSGGMPVHSIGHGQVTYAQPFGWGSRDEGVVIVRHTFPGGDSVLSFYGHLAPASVTLRAGDCIARGASVGRIGAPQHLHFELRTHTPHTPGPGYWSVDPTLAGWRPPAETIWNYRIATAPGLVWSWPYSAPHTRLLGQTDDGALIVVQDRQLLEINAGDGRVRWSRPLSHRPKDALLDLDNGLVYLTASLGRIQAFSLAELRGAGPGPVSTPPAAVWTNESKAYGDVSLLPLPGGGVIVATEQCFSGVSARGAALWSIDTLTPLYDWALTGNGVTFSTRDERNPLWSVDASGPLAWDVTVGGHLVVSSDASYVYAEDGLYRLEPTARCAELVYALPPGDLDAGDIAPLPAGGLLVAHVDKYDQRLIALNPDGSLRWERSIAAFSPERARLLVFDGQVYVALQRDTRESNLVMFFLIDADSAELAHLFTGGSRRNSSPADTWARAVGDEYVLMNIGGGRLVALDPRLALDAVLSSR